MTAMTMLIEVSGEWWRDSISGKWKSPLSKSRKNFVSYLLSVRGYERLRWQCSGGFFSVPASAGSTWCKRRERCIPAAGEIGMIFGDCRGVSACYAEGSAFSESITHGSQQSGIQTRRRIIKTMRPFWLSPANLSSPWAMIKILSYTHV